MWSTTAYDSGEWWSGSWFLWNGDLVAIGALRACGVLALRWCGAAIGIEVYLTGDGHTGRCMNPYLEDTEMGQRGRDCMRRGRTDG